MIDTTVLDDVIRRGFPHLLAHARQDQLATREPLTPSIAAGALPGIVLVYRAAVRHGCHHITAGTWNDASLRNPDGKLLPKIPF